MLINNENNQTVTQYLTEVVSRNYPQIMAIVFSGPGCFGFCLLLCLEEFGKVPFMQPQPLKPIHFRGCTGKLRELRVSARLSLSGVDRNNTA